MSGKTKGAFDGSVRWGGGGEDFAGRNFVPPEVIVFHTSIPTLLK